MHVATSLLPLSLLSSCHLETAERPLLASHSVGCFCPLILLEPSPSRVLISINSIGTKVRGQVTVVKGKHSWSQAVENLNTVTEAVGWHACKQEWCRRPQQPSCSGCKYYPPLTHSSLVKNCCVFPSWYLSNCSHQSFPKQLLVGTLATPSVCQQNWWGNA